MTLLCVCVMCWIEEVNSCSFTYFLRQHFLMAVLLISVIYMPFLRCSVVYIYSQNGNVTQNHFCSVAIAAAAMQLLLSREMVCAHKKVGAKKPSMVSSSPSCHVLYRVEAAVSGCKKGKRFGAYLWHLCYKCMGLYTHCTMRVFIIGAQLLFLCNGRYAAFIRISLLVPKYPYPFINLHF